MTQLELPPNVAQIGMRPRLIADSSWIDDGPSVLVYMWDEHLAEWTEPEVAYWDGDSWVVAGCRVQWPTHWLPLPRTAGQPR